MGNFESIDRTYTTKEWYRDDKGHLKHMIFPSDVYGVNTVDVDEIYK